MIGFSDAAEALGISKPGLHVWVKTEKIHHALDAAGDPVMLFTGRVGRPGKAFTIDEVERAAKRYGRAANVATWLEARRAEGRNK